MIVCEFQRIAAELAPVLARFRLTAGPVDAATEKRRRQIRESMQRLRARRRRDGLNNRGVTPKPNTGRPPNQRRLAL